MNKESHGTMTDTSADTPITFECPEWCESTEPDHTLHKGPVFGDFRVWLEHGGYHVTKDTPGAEFARRLTQSIIRDLRRADDWMHVRVMASMVKGSFGDATEEHLVNVIRSTRIDWMSLVEKVDEGLSD